MSKCTKCPFAVWDAYEVVDCCNSDECPPQHKEQQIDVERTVRVSLDGSGFNFFEFNTTQHEWQSEDEFIEDIVNFVFSNIQVEVI